MDHVQKDQKSLASLLTQKTEIEFGETEARGLQDRYLEIKGCAEKRASKNLPGNMLSIRPYMNRVKFHKPDKKLNQRFARTIPRICSGWEDIRSLTSQCGESSMITWDIKWRPQKDHLNSKADSIYRKDFSCPTLAELSKGFEVIKLINT